MADVVKQKENNYQEGGVTGKGFKPGQSGNPKGRPPVGYSLREAIREFLAQRDPDFKHDPQKKDKSRLQLILEAMAKKAAKGDARAAEFLANRSFGVPKQTVELEHRDKDEVAIIK